jgi:hypothetical protein
MTLALATLLNSITSEAKWPARSEPPNQLLISCLSWSIIAWAVPYNHQQPVYHKPNHPKHEADAPP